MAEAISLLFPVHCNIELRGQTQRVVPSENQVKSTTMNKKNAEVFIDGQEITAGETQPAVVTIRMSESKDHSGAISLLDNEQTQLLHYLLNNLLVHYNLDVAEVYLKDINLNTLIKVAHCGKLTRSPGVRVASGRQPCSPRTRCSKLLTFRVFQRLC
jgi:hypothetical protein